jgi:hypothetical protein
MHSVHHHRDLTIISVGAISATSVNDPMRTLSMARLGVSGLPGSVTPSCSDALGFLDQTHDR